MLFALELDVHSILYRHLREDDRLELDILEHRSVERPRLLLHPNLIFLDLNPSTIRLLRVGIQNIDSL